MLGGNETVQRYNLNGQGDKLVSTGFAKQSQSLAGVPTHTKKLAVVIHTSNASTGKAKRGSSLGLTCQLAGAN